MRLSEGPHTEDPSTVDYELPTPDQLRLLTPEEQLRLYLQGVAMNDAGRCNWILSEGGFRSAFDDLDPRPMQEFILDRKADVAKVLLFEEDSEMFGHYFTGLRVFDSEERILLQCGKFYDPYRTIILAEGERIIGLKARVVQNCPTTVMDLKFKIAKPIDS